MKNRNTKHWNTLTVIALGFLISGWFIAKSHLLFGRILLTVGIICIAVSIFGSSRYDKKHPPRCPYCGEELVTLGRRYHGGLYHMDFLDLMPCPQCGAMVSTDDSKQRSDESL